jgi:hypothetical protein
MVKKSALSFLPSDLLEGFPLNLSYYEIPGDNKGAFNISENSTDSYFKAQPTTGQLKSTDNISTGTTDYVFF